MSLGMQQGHCVTRRESAIEAETHMLLLPRVKEKTPCSSVKRLWGASSQQDTQGAPHDHARMPSPKDVGLSNQKPSRSHASLAGSPSLAPWQPGTGQGKRIFVNRHSLPAPSARELAELQTSVLGTGGERSGGWGPGAAAGGGLDPPSTTSPPVTLGRSRALSLGPARPLLSVACVAPFPVCTADSTGVLLS